MDQNQRQKRLRRLVKAVNKQRKRQASQIDILCKDLIAAQRDFLHRLGGVSFAAHFYKSLLGATGSRSLLSQAARGIQEELPGVNVSFFLRRAEGMGSYVSHRKETLLVGDQPLEEYFSADLIDNICKANRPCAVDEMFGMGLEGNPEGFKQLSFATLPLSDLGRSLGFVLLSRRKSQSLTAAELHRVGLITCGLSHAIAACRLPLHSNG
jgi:hypothetical protein